MDASKRPASIPLIKQELQRVAALEFTQGSSSTPSSPQPGQGSTHHQLGKKAQRVPQSAKNSPQTIGTLLYTHTGHTQPVVAVAWSPNNQRIASASYDGTVQIWDATTG